MPKVIKGDPRRRPPEPSAGHSDIDEWFATVMPTMQPVVRALDETIRDEAPGLQYAVKYRRAFYGRPDLGWVIELAPYFVSVNVLFLGGAQFQAPPELGSGSTRYVKVTSPEEVDRPELRAWIREAARTPGWR
jgi:hypothetical protein